MKKFRRALIASIATTVVASSAWMFGAGAAAASQVSARDRAAVRSDDPLQGIFRSLHLGRDAAIAALASRGSCEAGELAAITQTSQVTSLERDDLGGPSDPQRCPAGASIFRVTWPDSALNDGSPPVRRLDMLWVAGGYHRLYAGLGPQRMAAVVRGMTSALGPRGTLVVADRMAPSGADPMTAAMAGSMDPQVVLEQVEGAGLRLQTFANDAHPGIQQTPAQRATRFVMVFGWSPSPTR